MWNEVPGHSCRRYSLETRARNGCSMPSCQRRVCNTKCIRDVSLYAGATVKEANYRVDDEFGDSHGIPRLNNAIVTYSEIRTGAGFDWKISPIVTFTGEVGYQPYRDFDFYRAEVRYHQDGGAPYGTISLHGAF